MSFKKLMKAFKKIAIQNAENQFDNIWLQRSKEVDGEYINQSTSVDVLMSDKTDEWIYNLWSKVSEEGVAEMDNFVETELLPKGLRLLEDTELVSGDKGSVRYMIARNNMVSKTTQPRFQTYSYI